jgi:hypothetical protein
VTVTYNCSLSGVTGSFTNTMTVTAITGPGPTLTQTASADVTVQAAPQAPISTPAPTTTVPSSSNPTRETATVATVSTVTTKVVMLDTAEPKLALTLKLSKATTVTLTLVNSKGHVVGHWTQKVAAGSHSLKLVLPKTARKAGTDTLRVTTHGSTRVKTTRVTLRR